MRTLAIRRVEIDEASFDVGALSDAILQVAHRELERSRSNRSVESFLTEVQQHHSRLPSHPYLPAIVCSLIVLGRREDARAVCVTARAAQESGGFMVGSRTFGDLAKQFRLDQGLERSVTRCSAHPAM